MALSIFVMNCTESKIGDRSCGTCTPHACYRGSILWYLHTYIHYIQGSILWYLHTTPISLTYKRWHQGPKEGQSSGRAESSSSFWSLLALKTCKSCCDCHLTGIWACHEECDDWLSHLDMCSHQAHTLHATARYLNHAALHSGRERHNIRRIPGPQEALICGCTASSLVLKCLRIRVIMKHAGHMAHPYPTAVIHTQWLIHTLQQSYIHIWHKID